MAVSTQSSQVALERHNGIRLSRVRIVLPAFNEEAALPALLARIDQTFMDEGLTGDVLVVNDGSTDHTAIIARQHEGPVSVQLLDLQPNRGLAEALMNGLVLAVKGMAPDDVIITMDADNSHPPGLFPRMIQTIREGSDVVIASRYQRGARVVGVSAFRQFLSLGASILFRMIASVPSVRDYTCGYRGYRVSMLQLALSRYGSSFIQQQGFGCMAEVLLKLKPLEPIINEVPLVLRYDLKKSRSKMKIGKTVRETLFMLLRYRLRWSSRRSY